MNHIDKARARMLIAKMRWDKVDSAEGWWGRRIYTDIYKDYRDSQYEFIRAVQGGGAVDLLGLDLESAVKSLLK